MVVSTNYDMSTSAPRQQ